MSDTYCYICGADTHQLELSDYESKLTARIIYESLREPLGRVFAPHRAGLRLQTRSHDLIAACNAVLDVIKSEGELLQYRYSLATRGHGSEGGGVSCTYRGQHATAESGPGYCRITATRLENVPIRPGGPLEAKAVDTILADLRS